MKKLLTIALVALASLVALPHAAQAGPSLSITYQSGRSACGCAIYTKRIVAGYDSHRRPVYRYISLPVSHHCGHGHGAHRILRTSSCAPPIVPRCRTWPLPVHNHCHRVIPSHRYSRPLIRIRTHCR